MAYRKLPPAFGTAKLFFYPAKLHPNVPLYKHHPFLLLLPLLQSNRQLCCSSVLCYGILWRSRPKASVASRTYQRLSSTHPVMHLPAWVLTGLQAPLCLTCLIHESVLNKSISHPRKGNHCPCHWCRCCYFFVSLSLAHQSKLANGLTLPPSNNS